MLKLGRWGPKLSDMSKPEASEAMIADASFCVFWWFVVEKKDSS